MINLLPPNIKQIERIVIDQRNHIQGEPPIPLATVVIIIIIEHKLIV